MATGPTTTEYRERLTLPWPWWPLALGGTAALVSPFGLAAGGGLGPVVVAAAVLAVAAGLGWLGRIRVAVEAGELRVDDARLPVRFIRQVLPLDPAGRRELLGPAADPLAFVVQRPWVRGAVQVVLDDRRLLGEPADPTPYWLVSTRHPDRLVAALEQDRPR